jgi:nucleoside-diphosphate-sugar epimerase
LAELAGYANLHFRQCDVADRDAIAELFAAHRFDVVIHLAAQAGVRHSLIDPHAYADANIIGFLNILEGCRHVGCKHLIYASSSSVYGANTRMPLRTSDNTDHPLSLYGATKKANELMAHSYAHLFGLPATGLRFFTVYGPWGRPDMAMWLFTAAIMDGTPLKLFNNGRLRRDFTYIDDVTETVIRLVKHPPDANLMRAGGIDRAFACNRAKIFVSYSRVNSNQREIGIRLFGRTFNPRGQDRERVVRITIRPAETNRSVPLARPDLRGSCPAIRSRNSTPHRTSVAQRSLTLWLFVAT